MDVDSADPGTGRAPVRGLTTAVAAERLLADGPNVLPSARRHSPVRRFLRELTHFFALMLWVAAGLALVAGMPQLAVAVVAVVVLNAVFSFVQESRADRAAERLKSLLPARVTVLRDGRRQEVQAADVVVGDLLVLAAGDRIPADGVVGTLDHAPARHVDADGGEPPGRRGGARPRLRRDVRRRGRGPGDRGRHRQPDPARGDRAAQHRHPEAGHAAGP